MDRPSASSPTSSRPRLAPPIGPRAPRERPVSSPVSPYPQTTAGSPRQRYSRFAPPNPNSPPIPVLPGLIPISVLGPAFEATGSKPRSATVSAGTADHPIHRGRSNYPRDRQSVVRTSTPVGVSGIQFPVVPQESERHVTGALATISRQETVSPQPIERQRVTSPIQNHRQSTISPHIQNNRQSTVSPPPNHRQSVFHSPTVHRHSTYSAVFAPSRQMSLPPHTSTAPTSPVTHNSIPLSGEPLTAPKAKNVEFQRTMDEITEKINVLVARGNGIQPQQGSAERDYHRLSIPPYSQRTKQDQRASMKPAFASRAPQQDDKENDRMEVEASPPPVPPKNGYNGLGLAIGREMGNLIYIDGNGAVGNGDWSENGGMKSKEKRSRG
jgi:hypothetical protein